MQNVSKLNFHCGFDYFQGELLSQFNFYEFISLLVWLGCGGAWSIKGSTFLGLDAINGGEGQPNKNKSCIGPILQR